MAKIDKTLIGKLVYLKYIGYSEKDESLHEYIIKTVGFRYIHVWKDQNENTKKKFHIDSKLEVTSFSPEWCLFLSKQDYQEDEEKKKIILKLSYWLGGYHQFDKLSIDQLRRIYQIIQE
jgi:hypothetical protein